jgi:catechol 2,3-dioxygenase-like lactoylglutathione lyase family enzyme
MAQDHTDEQVSVRYIVDDVDAAVDHYTTHLGFRVDMRPAPGFAMLSRGPLRLLLNAPGAGGGGQGADGESPEPGGWNRVQLTVDDFDATVDRLRRARVRMRGDVVEGRGGRQLLVEDPAGNLVELFEPARR